MKMNVLFRVINILAISGIFIFNSCDSADDIPDMGFSDIAEIDEHVALELASGNFNAAFELDTVFCYDVYDDRIEHYNVNLFEGSRIPQRGDYLELAGDKIYYSLYLTGWKSMMSDELINNNHLMQDGSRYNDDFYGINEFSYDLTDSSYYSSGIKSGRILRLTNDVMIIRSSYNHDDFVNVWDYHYKKTNPRNFSNIFDNDDDAFEYVKSVYIEAYGEDEYNDFMNRYGYLPCY